MKHESVVFCEGYFDRAFWKGWLKYLDCMNLFEVDRPVRDPWKLKVIGGQFGFLSPTQEFIRVIPCLGKQQVLEQVRIRLRQRDTKPVRHLVVNWDADTFDLTTEEAAAPRTRVGDIVGSLQPDASATAEGDYMLPGTLPTRVSLVVWSAPDEPAPGIPAKQTLERLCCAAIRDAYPDRGERVSEWLESLANQAPDNPKSYSWSYMAGWYPEQGCEAFFELLWQDDIVAAALQARLESAGAWRVADALIG